MNLDSIELQVFVSLLLVLGALFVAFICDFLKGNNEVLRERNIELTVRQEERERLARLGKSAPAEAKRPPAPESAYRPRPADNGRSTTERAAPAPTPEPPAHRLVEVIPRRLIAAKVTPMEVPPDLAAEHAGPIEHTQPAPAAAAGIVSDSPAARAASEPVRFEEVFTAAVAPAPEPLDVSPEVSSEAAGELEPPTPVPAPSPTLPINPGIHDRAALESLLQQKELFRGVVVAVGVTRGEQRAERVRAEDDQSAHGVETLIGSLLEARDAAFRMDENEFVLLLPDESGAGAQRRLQHISEVLWDYQIRSMARSWILFSWGSVEVDGEPLAEGVAAARERMLQTRRNRERPPSEIFHYRTNHRSH